MAVIDKANAFYLRPVNGGSPFTESTAVAYDSTYAAQAQADSNILDFGADTAASNHLTGFLNVVTTSEAGGTVKLQDSDNMGSWAEVAGSTVTLGAGVKAASIAMPAHRRYVKAVLDTLTSADTDVYIGARADI